MSLNFMQYVEIADRHIRELRREVAQRDERIRDYDRRVSRLEADLVAALGLRDDAEELAAIREQQIGDCLRLQAELEDRCAALEGDKHVLETQLERNAGLHPDADAEDALAQLPRDARAAIRSQLRSEQALRARLAKTDMSQSARLRTLREAERAGLLNAELEAELWELDDAIE
ncbi:MAG: hypothetical protein JNK45_08575 [Myxococcales bacterium]|nr:hypothetical protein [Myxococcales bacterium]